MKALVHRVLNKAGFEVRLVRNLKSARQAEKRDRELEAWRILSGQAFETILDIGANEGQFARIARQIWPGAMIHSFEPLPQVYSTLVAHFRGDGQVLTHNIALSNRPGTQVMHSSDFSPSSSLLTMAQLHRKEWPHSATHSDVEVRLERLDDWAKVVTFPVGPLLIKIDVQGYESQVIAGGEDTLRLASYVVLEVSFHELYEQQALFADIHALMCRLGFVYRGNVEQYSSKDKSRVLYADAIFENTRLMDTDD